MSPYEIHRPDGPERGVRVRCREHDHQQEFRPGQRGGTFYCPDCGVELEVGIHDPHDWRDMGERC